MTKEKMLEVIYEKIADKSLSFGCKIRIEPRKLASMYFEDNYKHGTTLDDVYKIAQLEEGFKKLGDEVIYMGHTYSINIDKVLIGFRQHKRIKLDITPARDYNRDYLDYIYSLDLERGGVKIIGHPVMIGDVLDYIDPHHLMNKELKPCEFSDGITKRFNEVLLLWYDYKLSIDKQSIKCIEYIYNLIKK